MKNTNLIIKKKNIYSILRELEYIKLSALDLAGDILDIGGSQKSGYHEIIKREDNKIITANINPEYGCDLVFDIQERFPMENEKYSAVIALNVLEHIFNFHNVFNETCRILKKDGQFIFAVPFLYQIHGSPDDYFRYTKSALEKLLKESGFEEIEITTLGYGVFSLFFQIMGGVLPQILRDFFKKISIGLDRILLKFFSRYKKLNERIPLGYFVIAKKN
ncbi:MAG: methyltransferase domain-containing protein [Patescibacteria group bacterium]|nr:methyltransferase domain-containing protein [Patescibacteria group bacterium]MDD4611073.1 methyltransferase domain-containing protein [Patescibacteria group bacterium]